MNPKILAAAAMFLATMITVSVMPSETLALIAMLIVALAAGGAGIVALVVYGIRTADQAAQRRLETDRAGRAQRVSVSVETGRGRARVAAEINGDRIAAELEEGASLRIDSAHGWSEVDTEKRRIPAPVEPGRPGQPRRPARIDHSRRLTKKD